MSIQNEKKDKQSSGLSEIDIHYLKTGNYRIFHVDGAFGGPTPNGQIYMALFVERATIPEVVRYEIKRDGSLSEEISRLGKTGAVREVEAGIIMNLETAKSLREWLNQKITEIESVFNPPAI